MNKPKLCLVCTTGGHFEQMTNLSEFYSRFDHFWITNRNRQTESQLAGETVYYINSAHYKKPWGYLQQLPCVAKAISEQKPTHFISTGSGRTALIPFLAAKITGKNFSHIDTFSRVYGYSKFGTFLLKLGHPVLSQWEDGQNERVTYIGPIFKTYERKAPKPKLGHIFVTVGTRSEPFTRLIQSVEDLVRKGVIQNRVIVQAGHTSYRSDHLEIFDFCSQDEIDSLIDGADFVITQESAGIGNKCLKLETPFLVMPREYRYRELPSKSDMNEDLHWKLQNLGYTKVVTNRLELESAIRQLNDIKTGFVFDNSRAVRTLLRIMGR